MNFFSVVFRWDSVSLWLGQRNNYKTIMSDHFGDWLGGHRLRFHLLVTRVKPVMFYPSRSKFFLHVFLVLLHAGNSLVNFRKYLSSVHLCSSEMLYYTNKTCDSSRNASNPFEKQKWIIENCGCIPNYPLRWFLDRYLFTDQLWQVHTNTVLQT